MITKITGELVSLQLDSITLRSGAFEYEVLVPEFTRRQLQNEKSKTISLHTIFFMDGNPQMGKQVPRLIGFLTEAEREFFDLFCSVDGIGTRKALRAMIRPVNEIATAIEEKDEKFITSLPGIGAAMAERVVAKLRRKVPKFALLITRQVPDSETQPDIVTEAFNALIGLGHTESEARRLIDTVIETKTKFKTWDEILNAIYQKNKS